MIDVAVLFLDGGHASTAIGPLEVFRSAGQLWNELMGETPTPRFRVRAASIDGGPVRPAGPYSIAPDAQLDAVEGSSLVFVPAAGLEVDVVLEQHAVVIDFLARTHASGSRVAGVCTGVSLMAAAGLLDGKMATTHWGVVDAYRERFPHVDWRSDQMVTEDAGIYTGAGVYAALDLALYIVEQLVGRESALQCAKSLVIDMPRDCQAGFAVLPIGARHEDPAIRRAEEFIRQHCREEIRFEALSRTLGMSGRNFVRRVKLATGIAPVDYLQRLRVRAARRLLEGGRASVSEVSAAVGYEDAAFFRSLFKRHTGLTPAAYKQRFSDSRERL